MRTRHEEALKARMRFVTIGACRCAGAACAIGKRSSLRLLGARAGSLRCSGSADNPFTDG
jgi:hypothetical protein